LFQTRSPDYARYAGTTTPSLPLSLSFATDIIPTEYHPFWHDRHMVWSVQSE